ncbi:MAG: hypothetical protein WCF30_07090 [Terracidiphilus sp.]
MQEPEAPAANPELKELVVEASRSLALLDAPRLEELAVSCEALNRNLEAMGADEKRELARQAREAQADMSVLARVLEATRANQNVMRRLREMRERRLEYDERMIRAGTAAVAKLDSEVVAEVDGEAEGVHGDD